jgi:hypothetical protein
MCAGALYWSQISKMVYGASDVQRGFKSMGTQLHPKTTVVKVSSRRSGRSDETFFASKEKIELVTLSKYFLPLLFRDYNYRTGGNPFPPVIFFISDNNRRLVVSFLYSKSTLVRIE